MIETAIARRGVVSAPHRLAAQAGLRVLEDGGNAIEAMIAAAATITVVYPHMNSLGGDNFWLIHDDTKTHAIDACGAAAAAASAEYYRNRGVSGIPPRGPLAALTVAGAPSGWQAALEISAAWGGRLTLPRLLEDAIWHARNGFAVSRNLHTDTASKHVDLESLPGFTDQFLPDGKPPLLGQQLAFPTLADTFEHLGRVGLNDFYRGDLARLLAKGLEKLGSPLALADFETHYPKRVRPLSLAVFGGTVRNMPPPTQGLASLIILGLLERLKVTEPESVDYVHAVVEATKQAFAIRDSHVTDPDYMSAAPSYFLSESALNQMAGRIDMTRAAPWPNQSKPGDTVWLGAADQHGRVVSFIQSIYWEFGAGVVIPGTGIVWQNRGTSFSLNPKSPNPLMPGRRPFHTIQPALASLHDGRIMAYGSMGGDGQPQTQAAIFSRYAVFGDGLQEAISAPRWLLGRTWGSETTKLRLESRFSPDFAALLAARGHEIELVGPYDGIMGHAGAVVSRPDGFIEGAADPRSDGAALAF